MPTLKIKSCGLRIERRISYRRFLGRVRQSQIRPLRYAFVFLLPRTDPLVVPGIKLPRLILTTGSALSPNFRRCYACTLSRLAVRIQRAD